MTTLTFRSWLEQRHRPDPIHVPESDRLSHLIAASGQTGISRRRLGHLFNLPPRLLDQLLTALVQLGQVTVKHHPGCGDYYQSVSVGGVVGEDGEVLEVGLARCLSPLCVVFAHQPLRALVALGQSR